MTPHLSLATLGPWPVWHITTTTNTTTTLLLSYDYHQRVSETPTTRTIKTVKWPLNSESLAYLGAIIGTPIVSCHRY